MTDLEIHRFPAPCQGLVVSQETRVDLKLEIMTIIKMMIMII